MIYKSIYQNIVNNSTEIICKIKLQSIWLNKFAKRIHEKNTKIISKIQLQKEFMEQIYKDNL